MNACELSSKETLENLKSDPQGLSVKEAKRRFEKNGPNEIREIGGPSWPRILLNQFLNIMVLILMVALIVSLATGEFLDAIAVGVIVVLNAITGFIQEFKAERAVEALKKMAAPMATVVRDGKIYQIPARELVLGDVVILEEGAQIPADARLLEASQMQAIEASLTGESLPVEKHTERIKKWSGLGDQNNMVFMGTILSQGHGKAVVTAIGMGTEFGKIAHLVQTESSGPTPLQKQMDRLSKWMAVSVCFLIALLLIVSILTGKDLLEVFMLSVSLAVGVIPEGLPAVITLTLAIGVQQMARQNAIVRKLPAAETLGSTQVICTDKTGTLTQNRMTVEKIHFNGKTVELEKLKVGPKELDLILRAGCLCNNAKLIEEDEGTKLSGDPTEGAFLFLAKHFDINPLEVEASYPRENELVFDSKRKRMSTLNQGMVYTKGAPDMLLEACTHIQENGKVLPLTEEMRKKILEENNALAQEAYRVLGLAYKKHTEGEIQEEGLTFLGLVAMIDPPRPEVAEAIQVCKRAHIQVVMITGDHALTAKAIGEKIGLYKEGNKVLTGDDLEKLDENTLAEMVEKVSIYARVSPEHKVKILKAFQKKGFVVAMTGDGVNDAPALKSADIGVAMGITGTDVAKAASKMILLDDNFSTIVKSIESGRSIFKNIEKFVRFLLSANIGEVLTIVILYFLGYTTALIPLQILWINLLTDAFPAIALGMDPAHKGVMLEKPRDHKSSIWTELIETSLISGALATGICVFLFLKNIDDLGLEHTRTLIFTAIVMFELFLVFSVRFMKSHYFTGFFSNIYLLLGVGLGFGLQLLGVYVPFFQDILKTAPLNALDWAWIVGLCIASMMLLEGWKILNLKRS